jgi:hypothetical protein
VSQAAAREEYRVVLAAGADDDEVDAAATADLRGQMRAGRNTPRPVIDRGTGREKMLRGEFKPWKQSG